MNRRGCALTAAFLIGSTTAHAGDSLLLRFRQHMLDQALESGSTVSGTSVDNSRGTLFGAPRYPWKLNITSTVFWAGEAPNPSIDDPGNLRSAWNASWVADAAHENPFYVALPYNDVSEHHTKPEARQVVPWFRTSFVRDGQSVCKDRWVEIRHQGRVAYAQWKDVGPFSTDHWQYVFGSERPRPNGNRDAGIDVSPAVRDYLGLAGIDTCDWRFIEARQVPHGPWLSSPSHFAQR
jgi:hypothetical protein